MHAEVTHPAPKRPPVSRRGLSVFERERAKTKEQIAREYRHLKKIERERAKARQAASAKKNQPQSQNPQNLADSEPEQEIAEGDARKLAASQLGISHATADKMERHPCEVIASNSMITPSRATRPIGVDSMPDDDPHVIRADTPAEVAHSRLNRFLDRIHAARVESIIENPTPPDDELLQAERAYMLDFARKQQGRLEEHEAKRAKDSAKTRHFVKEARKTNAERKEETIRILRKAVAYVRENVSYLRGKENTKRFKEAVRNAYTSEKGEPISMSYLYRVWSEISK